MMWSRLPRNTRLVRTMRVTPTCPATATQPFRMQSVPASWHYCWVLVLSSNAAMIVPFRHTLVTRECYVVELHHMVHTTFHVYRIDIPCWCSPLPPWLHSRVCRRGVGRRPGRHAPPGHSSGGAGGAGRLQHTVSRQHSNWPHAAQHAHGCPYVGHHHSRALKCGRCTTYSCCKTLPGCRSSGDCQQAGMSRERGHVCRCRTHTLLCLAG